LEPSKVADLTIALRNGPSSWGKPSSASGASFIRLSTSQPTMKKECRARASAARTAPKNSSPSTRKAARVAVSMRQQLRPGARIDPARSVSRSCGNVANAVSSGAMAIAMLASARLQCLSEPGPGAA